MRSASPSLTIFLPSHSVVKLCFSSSRSWTTSRQHLMMASLGVIVPSVETRSSKVAKSGCGTLYAEKTM
jgi:hypothetical protein